VAQPTDQPATDQTIGSLISEAIGARQMLPPYDRCIDLDRQLRDHLAHLLPHVQERAADAPVRSREWYRLQGLVDDAQDVLNAGLGHGLLSAAIQVGRLAEQCQVLQAETDRRPVA
jgi:hypothetical protein